ncbi:MAG: hypothetical protein ABR559_09730 [Gemmatimonadota bacterium]
MPRQPIGGLALLLAASGCGDLPSSPIVPDDVASVQIQNTCAFIPVEEQCVISARALSTTGLVIASPRLSWTSNNTSFFTVSGTGGQVTVRGRNPGSALLRVASISGRATDQVQVRIVPRVAE